MLACAWFQYFTTSTYSSHAPQIFVHRLLITNPKTVLEVRIRTNCLQINIHALYELHTYTYHTFGVQYIANLRVVVNYHISANVHVFNIIKLTFTITCVDA